MIWEPHFFKSGSESSDFWRLYLNSQAREVLFILSAGIDPRMCWGYRQIIESGGTGKRNCIAFVYDEGESSPTHTFAPYANSNLEELKLTIASHGHQIRLVTIPIWTVSGSSRRRIAAPKTLEFFRDHGLLDPYTDIILDISAMRRGVYMPLLGRLIQLLRTSSVNPKINLFIILGNSPDLDRKITNVGLDDSADYILGFTGDLEMQGDVERPRVWMPILGEGHPAKLERVNALVRPSEICPILPAITSTGRRADQILVQYRELIFDTWRVEPGNLLFASENNPFDVYRQIHRAAVRYNTALGPVGGCKIVISALGSKLLSVGATLAAADLKVKDFSVGMAHIESQGYELAPEISSPTPDFFAGMGDLSTAWLVGECYEP